MGVRKGTHRKVMALALSDEDMDRLEKLAARDGMSRTAMVRAMIRTQWAWREDRILPEERALFEVYPTDTRLFDL